MFQLPSRQGQQGPQCSRRSHSPRPARLPRTARAEIPRLTCRWCETPTPSVSDPPAVHPVWAGVPDEAWFYFVHSYHARPSDPRHRAGETDYGGSFTSALARDNIFATQFHPEKSADHGLALYRNFLRWNP